MNTSTRDQSGQQPEMAKDLRHDAARLKESVGARARQEAESRKGQAAHLAGSASSALETAAQDLRDNPDAPDWMATALQSTARRIEELARHVDGRSIDELGRDIAGFARRSPGTFLAASAAAGFAAARVLRAGVDHKRHARDASDGSAQQWQADENIRPEAGGGFTPAYSGGNDEYTRVPR
jgi:hypothetical protein